MYKPFLARFGSCSKYSTHPNVFVKRIRVSIWASSVYIVYTRLGSQKSVYNCACHIDLDSIIYRKKIFRASDDSGKKVFDISKKKLHFNNVCKDSQDFDIFCSTSFSKLSENFKISSRVFCLMFYETFFFDDSIRICINN